MPDQECQKGFCIEAIVKFPALEALGKRELRCLPELVKLGGVAEGKNTKQRLNGRHDVVHDGCQQAPTRERMHSSDNAKLGVPGFAIRPN